MSVIIIPRKHLRQPQGRVTIAPEWAGHFSSAAVHGALLPPDSVAGRAGWLYGGNVGPQLVVTGAGVGVKAGAATNAIVPAYQLPEISGDYTFVAIASANSYSNSPTILDADDFPYIRHMQFRFATTGKIEHIGFNTSGQPAFSYSEAAAPAGSVVCAAVTRRGQALRTWMHGVPGSTASLSGEPQPAFWRLTIAGSQSSNLDDCVNGGAAVLAWAAAPYALEDDELAGITQSAKNFWQLFRADPIRIYSLPSGPISLAINSITASNITSSGARITLGLTR